MQVNFNPEMKKLFVAITIVCVGSMLVFISAQTPSASPDASTDEEGIADEVTDRTEQCDCPSSPDGKFDFVLSFGEKDAFESCNASTTRKCPLCGMCSGHPIRMGSL